MGKELSQSLWTPPPSSMIGMQQNQQSKAGWFSSIGNKMSFGRNQVALSAVATVD